jgi:hypothetical protein
LSKNKFCVFCGEKPKNKNKEHIIPKWLIKMTGDPNRDILVGLNQDGTIKKFSINQFTLPACETCNTDFAKLEAETKPIMERILIGEKINSSEMSLILDWFDKVRIGLWLMYFVHDKNKANVLPKFHIKKRIGQYDRMLHIARSNSDEKRINFLGVQNFSFQMTPSAFGLIINNCSFINTSFEGLTSRRMGFPFFKKKYFVYKNDQFIFRVDLNQEGLQRVLTPIITTKFLLKGHTYYQAIYNDGLIEAEENLLSIYKSNEYVQENSLEFGKSKLISSYSNGTFYSKNEYIEVQKTNDYENITDLMMESMKQVLLLHIWIDKNHLKLTFEDIDKEFREAMKTRLKDSISLSEHDLKLCHQNKVLM